MMPRSSKPESTHWVDREIVICTRYEMTLQEATAVLNASHHFQSVVPLLTDDTAGKDDTWVCKLQKQKDYDDAAAFLRHVKAVESFEKHLGHEFKNVHLIDG